MSRLQIQKMYATNTLTILSICTRRCTIKPTGSPIDLHKTDAYADGIALEQSLTKPTSQAERSALRLAAKRFYYLAPALAYAAH